MTHNSNFIFFGTPEFAAIILEKLIKAGFTPEAVVCNPDQLVGRKKILTPPPTKVLAEKHNIKVFQPKTLVNSKFQIPRLRRGFGGQANYKFDFFVVAAYGKIIPKEILDIPHLGTIGVHPSLLPKLRGPSPIQTAILNGDKKTGVSLFLLDEKIDHGPIIVKRELENYAACGEPRLRRELKSINYEDLNRLLAELGMELLIETLPKWLKGEIKPAPQNEAEATYTKMIKRENGEINPQQETAEEIDRKIRALNPEPGTYIKVKSQSFDKLRIDPEQSRMGQKSKVKNIKILKANLVSDTNKISPVKEIGDFLIQEQKLHLKTKKGLIEIGILQPEGKKSITAKDFINGYLF